MSLLYATHALMVDDFHVETAPEPGRPVPVAEKNKNSMASLMAAMGGVQGAPKVG